ncbi:hypothetical protein GCM10025868_35510 [Angustibacter aerolatus]|uniref:Uncharacterized protein n=1 Tax=Angustibacter aerolatus TaxID=1162965 RepID=A0ABQ6JJ69_9ACTN|nr:hypothetical protein GCM10025868_35510 [Angustibacter aerolatus]
MARSADTGSYDPCTWYVLAVRPRRSPCRARCSERRNTRAALLRATRPDRLTDAEGPGNHPGLLRAGHRLGHRPSRAVGQPQAQPARWRARQRQRDVAAREHRACVRPHVVRRHRLQAELRPRRDARAGGPEAPQQVVGDRPRAALPALGAQDRRLVVEVLEPGLGEPRRDVGEQARPPRPAPP